MNRTTALREDLDDLNRTAEQIEALGIDSCATRDLLARLGAEIRAVRREMLLLDAAALLRAAGTAGGIA